MLFDYTHIMYYAYETKKIGLLMENFGKPKRENGSWRKIK